MDRLAENLSRVLRDARATRRISVIELAESSGVSRAMIGKIERGDAQPTASLLARLSGALGLTLSELIARAEGDERRLVRRDDQPVWVDPDSGYSRRAVSPPASDGLELVEVVLPAGAQVPMPAESYAFIRQQIWVLEGQLQFVEGDEVHHLSPGDCLQLGSPKACVFVNASNRSCRYVVALSRT